LNKAEGLDEGVNLAATEILDDEDLKKIRILKLRQAVKKVDRKGFASSDEEEEEDGEDQEGSQSGEEEYDDEEEEEVDEEELEDLSGE